MSEHPHDSAFTIWTEEAQTTMETQLETSFQTGPVRVSSPGDIGASGDTAGWEGRVRVSASWQVTSTRGDLSDSILDTSRRPFGAEDARIWAEIKQAESIHDTPTDTPFTHLDGTCEWVMSNSKYRGWVLSKRGFLCVIGSPGSGKSCLLSWIGSAGLIERTIWPSGSGKKQLATTTASDQPLVMYYSKLRGSSGNSVTGLLDSLLVNMLLASPPLPPWPPLLVALPGPGSWLKLHREDPMALGADFREALMEGVIRIARTRPIFWLIDSLDMILADHDVAGGTPWLLDFLGEMMQKACEEDASLHICYTRRDYPAMTSSILNHRAGEYFEVRIDDNNIPDIQRSFNDRTKGFPQKTREFILDRVGSGFGAAVAYADALTKELRFPGTDDLTIPPFPSTVGEMWESLLSQLDSRAVDMIELVDTAQRPLSLSEFSSVSEFPWSRPHPPFDNLEFYNAELITFTKGLLRLDGWNSDNSDTPRVFLIQESFATYLKSYQCRRAMGDFMQSRMVDPFSREALHWCFVKTGLVALNAYFPTYRTVWMDRYDEYRRGPALALEGDEMPYVETTTEFHDCAGQTPMITYTVQYLMTHASHIQSMGGLKDLFRQLDHRPDDRIRPSLLSMWCHLHNHWRGLQIYGAGVTIWHILAQYNMSNYLSQVSREDWDVAAETENGQTPLHWAVYYNSNQCAKLILDRVVEGESNARLNDALGKEPSTSDKRLMYLVDCQEAQYQRTALHLAAAKGHMDLVSMLLEYSKSLHEKLAEALKAHGSDRDTFSYTMVNIDSFDINTKSSGGFTALHYAACSKEPSIVAALLKHGADWRAESGAGELPLQLAIKVATWEMSLDIKTKEVVRILQAASFADVGLARTLKPDAESVNEQLLAHKVHFNGSEATVKRFSVKQLLNKAGRILDNESECIWIHLPANNMTWAEILLLLILSEKHVPNPDLARDRIMRRELWTDRHIRGSPRSFLSFMRPGCEIPRLPAGVKETMVLFMPYIHWETQDKQIILECFSVCKFIAELEPQMVRGFLSQLAAERRSLRLHRSSGTYAGGRGHFAKDAVGMYSTLANNPRANWSDIEDPVRRRGILSGCMSGYDVDLQLLDAYTSNETGSHPLHPRRTLDQYFYYTLDHTTRRNRDQVVARHGRRLGREQPVVLMVDQLWLWRMDNVIVSCFPQRRECGRDDPDRFDRTDVFENIIASLKADPIDMSEREGPMKLVLRIVRECFSTCFDPMKNPDDDFKFLDIFNNSINRVADEEVNCYECFVDTLKKPGHHDQLNTEFHLLREIKDIQEELGMMRQVFEEQKGVLLSMAEKQRSPSIDDLHAAVLDEGARYLGKILTMESQAKRTNDSINSLMDLRQRHASLSEAQATGRQGNTIMVFTVVTILFLPASFMASFFALPIAQFSRAQGDPDNMDLAYIVRWLLVFTVPVAAFFIFIAFYINEVLGALSLTASVVHKIIVMVLDLLLKMRRGIITLPIRFYDMRARLVFVMRRAGAADADADSMSYEIESKTGTKSAIDEEEGQPRVRRRKKDAFWRRV